MDNFFSDDLDFLVEETLKYHSTASNSLNLEEIPGVLYRVDNSSQTFVLRAFATDNLKLAYKNISDSPEDYPTLRLISEDGVNLSSLKAFECDNLSMAQNLKLQFTNKRFPLNEEDIINVSDPGDCWWASVDDDKIEIFFKLSKTDNMSKLIKLGPLGDDREIQKTLKQLRGYFNLLFKVKSYDVGYGRFCIEGDSSLMFKQLSHLLIEGDVDYDFWEELRKLEMKPEYQSIKESIGRANYFLAHLGVHRAFWKEVQDQIS